MKKCKQCGEEIKKDAKKCKHCGTDLRNWFVRHKILTLLLIIIAIGAIGSNVNESNNKEGLSSANETQEEKAWLDISCQEFHEFFGINSDLSDLQKDEKFKEYKGKWITWEGKVSSVDETFGQLQVQIKCLDKTFVSDAIASFSDSAKDDLLKYKKGDIIKFSGQLSSWSALMATSIRNAQILK